MCVCVQHVSVWVGQRQRESLCAHGRLRALSDYTVNKCVYLPWAEWSFSWKWKGVLKHFVVRRSADKCCNQIAVWRTMCGQNNELKSQGKNPQHTINTTDGSDSGRCREMTPSATSLTISMSESVSECVGGSFRPPVRSVSVQTREEEKLNKTLSSVMWKVKPLIISLSSHCWPLLRFCSTWWHAKIRWVELFNKIFFWQQTNTIIVPGSSNDHY